MSEPSRRRWRPKAGFVALATAVVALASASVGLAFDLHPEWRGDPRDRLGASLAVFAEESSVTVDDWLHRVSATDAIYRERRADHLRLAYADPAKVAPAEAAAMLAVRGQLFYVRTTIEGYKRRSSRLRWSLYDWRTKERVGNQGERDVPAADFSLGSPSDSSVALVWTPAVVRRGWFFVRFEIVDKQGTVLAVNDSQKFRSRFVGVAR